MTIFLRNRNLSSSLAKTSLSALSAHPVPGARKSWSALQLLLSLFVRTASIGLCKLNPALWFGLLGFVFGCWFVEWFLGEEPLCGSSPICVVWLRWFPTLPHPVGCSTIGVHGLSFQVRNGAGRFPMAMTTAKDFGINTCSDRALVLWCLWALRVGVPTLSHIHTGVC